MSVGIKEVEMGERPVGFVSFVVLICSSLPASSVKDAHGQTPTESELAVRPAF